MAVNIITQYVEKPFLTELIPRKSFSDNKKINSFLHHRQLFSYHSILLLVSDVFVTFQIKNFKHIIFLDILKLFKYAIMNVSANDRRRKRLPS